MERNAFEEFIDSPRTIDFIAENSDYFREFIKNKPYIVPGAALNGGYIIAYIDEKIWI